MVSRETLIADGAEQFGLALEPSTTRRLSRFAELLVEVAVPRGLLAEGERDRVVQRHILEGLALTRWLPPEGTYVDVGSGAGLPGLVLACVREGPTVLFEGQRRRAGFLREAAHELGVVVEVIADRVENVCRGDRRETAAAVTARALAPIPEALELVLPVCAIGGIVALPVGEVSSTELTVAASAAEELGGGPPELERFEVPGIAEPRWAMIVRKLQTSPDRYPRPPGPRRRHPAGGGVA